MILNLISRRRLVLVFLLFLFSLDSISSYAGGEITSNNIDNNLSPTSLETGETFLDLQDEKDPSFSSILKDGFSYSLRSLAFINMQYPSNSTQNPDNDFLNIYRNSYELNLRPDMYLLLPHIKFIVKPRLISYHRQWEDGSVEGNSENYTEGFFNEWLVRGELLSTTFLSYGKEKLLWGASFLANPSNPFFRENEKKNPFFEIEGKYFLKLIYLPNEIVTLTVLSNVRKDGRDDQFDDEFEPTHAFKSELMGDNFQIGLLGSRKEGGRFRFGSYGQLTVSDSTIAYFDATVAKGTDALYPEENLLLPFGAEFVQKYDDSDKLFTTYVIGGAYTFLSGETVTLEYLFNGDGYGHRDAKEYYNLREMAELHYFDNSVLSELSKKTLYDALNRRQFFLRRNYLMLQYMKKEIKDVIDITCRYTHNMDDQSGSFNSIGEWGLSDSVKFFNVITINRGTTNSEFRSILDGGIMIGLEHIF